MSLTRLRLRSWRFLPLFALDTRQALNQVRRAAGFQTGRVLPDRELTFWTLTGWDSRESMRRYILSGSHGKAMKKLLHWGDEASVTHWEQPGDELPTWEEADRRMRETGRPSKVKYPSAAHAGLQYRAPRTSRSVPVVKA